MSGLQWLIQKAAKTEEQDIPTWKNMNKSHRTVFDAWKSYKCRTDKERLIISYFVLWEFEYAERLKSSSAVAGVIWRARNMAQVLGLSGCHIPTCTGSQTEEWPEVCKCLKCCAQHHQTQKKLMLPVLGFFFFSFIKTFRIYIVNIQGLECLFFL